MQFVIVGPVVQKLCHVNHPVNHLTKTLTKTLTKKYNTQHKNHQNTPPNDANSATTSRRSMGVWWVHQNSVREWHRSLSLLWCHRPSSLWYFGRKCPRSNSEYDLCRLRWAGLHCPFCLLAIACCCSPSTQQSHTTSGEVNRYYGWYCWHRDWWPGTTMLHP